jgi:hypothetical protein
MTNTQLKLMYELKNTFTFKDYIMPEALNENNEFHATVKIILKNTFTNEAVYKSLIT